MRLLLDITAHGFGHLAQCAPVVAALRSAGPLELVVRSGLPAAMLRERLGPVDRHLASDTDFGAAMRNAMTVDAPATLARYRALHMRLQEEIRALSETLRALRIDGVLSNASYLAPAAAALGGVPCIAFSSLTWSDVLQAYFPEATDLLQQMRAGYRSATRILRLQPGTPFHGLDSMAVAAPIARIGSPRRPELAARLQLGAGRKLALIAFGGMAAPEPPPRLAAPGDFLLLGPESWAGAGAIPSAATGLPFQDLLASVDVVVTKPGYGTVAELACCGTPAVLIARPDWPEEPWLSRWLQTHDRCLVVESFQDVNSEALNACLALPDPPHKQLQPGGEADVARAVLEAVRKRGTE